MYIAFFKFKPTHTEKHFLMSTSARSWSGKITRDEDKAKLFADEEKAQIAIEKLIKNYNYGKDGGYSFVSEVTPAPAIEKWENELDMLGTKSSNKNYVDMLQKAPARAPSLSTLTKFIQNRASI
jgi:hypothetical protein